MKCPVCNDVRMREVEKNGVHIDVCPDCKGVWLDRGELEKLMSDVREVRQEYDEWYRNDGYKNDGNYRNDPHSRPHPNQAPYGYDPRYPKYKKKKNVFDIFDDLF